MGKPFYLHLVDLILSNNFSAGSSAGSWGTSWPRKALARMDGITIEELIDHS